MYGGGVSSVEKIEQFVYGCGCRGLVHTRLRLYLLQVRHDVIEGGSAARFVDQTVVYDLAQTLIALQRHRERLFVVANHAGDVRDGPSLERDVESEHLPQDNSKGVDIG